MEANQKTQIGSDLRETLDNCGRSGRKTQIVSEAPNQLRLSNIPHSGTHMLPGGMATLEVLSDHWNDWEIEYVDNEDTVMYGSKSDKDVIITRTA